mmetsp:Transcript_85077/g.150680  ORF Transcript_85077/g.150680 Transcript_85077/m.150680 type:complete len:1088 (-) Transcript_85077:54-3317(-)
MQYESSSRVRLVTLLCMVGSAQSLVLSKPFATSANMTSFPNAQASHILAVGDTEVASGATYTTFYNKWPAYWSCRQDQGTTFSSLTSAKSACDATQWCYGVILSPHTTTVKSGTYSAGRFYMMRNTPGCVSCFDPASGPMMMYLKSQTSPWSNGRQSITTISGSSCNQEVITARCANPDAANDETQSRTRYASSSVIAPASCSSQTQTRECDITPAQHRTDGRWSAWSGSYTHSHCSVVVQCSNPTASHGAKDTRNRYQSSQVNAPASCKMETQERTCSNGNWGGWSGSYSQTSCKVMAQCASPTTSHGGSHSRVMYKNSEENAPASCQSQTQWRSCNDGAWSSFSGSYMKSTCAVMARCSNPDTVSGGTASRIRYQASTVNAPASCQQQTQTAYCRNGAYPDGWSGSYTHLACVVKDFRAEKAAAESAATAASGSADAAKDEDTGALSLQADAASAAAKATEDSKAASEEVTKAISSVTATEKDAAKAADELPVVQAAASAAAPAEEACPVKVQKTKDAAKATADAAQDASSAHARAVQEKAVADAAAKKAAEEETSAEAAHQEAIKQKRAAEAAVAKAGEYAQTAASKASELATSNWATVSTEQAVALKDAAEDAASKAAAQKAAAETAKGKAKEAAALADAAAEKAAEHKGTAAAAAKAAAEEHAAGISAAGTAASQRGDAEAWTTKAIACKDSKEAADKAKAQQVLVEESAKRAAKQALLAISAAKNASQQKAIVEALIDKCAQEKAPADAALEDALKERIATDGAASKAAAWALVTDANKTSALAETTAFEAFKFSQPAAKSAANASFEKTKAEEAEQKVVKAAAFVAAKAVNAENIKFEAEAAVAEAGSQAAAALSAAGNVAKEKPIREAAAAKAAEEAATAHAKGLVADDMKYADEGKAAKEAAALAAKEAPAETVASDKKAGEATDAKAKAEAAGEKVAACYAAVAALAKEASDEKKLAETAMAKARTESAAAEASAAAAAQHVADTLAAEKGDAATQFEICKDQARFDVLMCTSYMCTTCPMSWCAKSCQKLQNHFPNCRCKEWVKGEHEGWARSSFSSENFFSGHGRFGDAGDYSKR